MSYLSRPGVGGRAPSAQRQSLGWIDSAVTLCTSFGDIAASSLPSSTEKLQRQLNRYTLEGGAPIQLRVAPTPLAITGTLDADTAKRAVWIMQMRAGMAHIQWNDGATKQLLDEAVGAWSDPQGFVTKHLDRITQIVKLFGDKMGVPPAKGIMPGLTPTIIAGALTLGALAFMFRKGGR